MEYLLIILGALCLLLGIIGCIIPAIPGVPLAYGGLWLLQATDMVQFSWKFLIIWGIVTVVVTILDTVVPVWGTKKLGGSKMGVWGSTIGLIAGMFLGPWGIIIGPFIGAVIFELIDNKNAHEAIKAGFGAFVGLLTGTILKLICCGMMTYYFITALV
ncbi:MAG: DUF456 domain-containing protein [Paludibacteraceae bacterium]|nr:DUF456 domain-containing protein [Paludibacteraceae bacterium]